MPFLRTVQINREAQAVGPSNAPRYWLADLGRYGEGVGAAPTLLSLTSQEVGNWLAREGLPDRDIQRVLEQLDRTGSAEVQLEPRVGPRIVRAWFDTVINPLIPALEAEVAFLERRHWTFSFRPPTLGIIQPIRRHLEQKAWANLEQILELYTEVWANVEAHDKAVESLLQSVTALHSALVSSPEFGEYCDSLFTPDKLSELGVTSAEQVFGAYPPSDRLSLIAQYVVNRSGEQPSHYSTARFWNANRESLLRMLELPIVRQHYAGTSQVADHLISVSRGLARQLGNMRRDLSLRYDMPYVVGDTSHSAA